MDDDAIKESAKAARALARRAQSLYCAALGDIAKAAGLWEAAQTAQCASLIAPYGLHFFGD